MKANQCIKCKKKETRHNVKFYHRLFCSKHTSEFSWNWLLLFEAGIPIKALYLKYGSDNQLLQLININNYD